MKLFRELTQEDQEKALNKIEDLDLPMFATLRANTKAFLMGSNIYYYDERLNRYEFHSDGSDPEPSISLTLDTKVWEDNKEEKTNDKKKETKISP